MTSARSESTLDIRSPFLRTRAIDHGITSSMLRSSRFQKVFQDVHVASGVPLTLTTRALAALLLHPPWAHLSHTTAAALYGVVVPDDPDVHVTVPLQEERRYRRGLQPHVRAAESTCSVLKGMRASAPLQMFVELAGQLALVEAVVAGDHMVRLGLISLDALAEHCRGLKGRHSRKARRVAAYVREGVDSPMETRLRMLLVLAGLPEPEVNFLVVDANGVILRRIDLSYPHLKLIIEYDGRQHAERVAQWHSDIDRREDFDQDGWRTLIVTSKGIYVEPQRTVERVARALRLRGARLRVVRDAYRAHFPGR